MSESNLDIALLALTRIERCLKEAQSLDLTNPWINDALKFATEAIETFEIPKEAYE